MDFQTLPTILHLKQDDVLLAVLESCEPVEMFWLGCKLEPTDAFSQVEALFRQASESLEGSNGERQIFDECYNKLREMNVVLVDVESNRTSRNFIMHIQDDTVEVRLSFEV
mgnify:CR=1 FL=1